MRSVSPSHGHIDYTYAHSAVMKVRIRVMPSRAIIMQSDGNDLDRLVAVDRLPGGGMAGFPSVAFAREEHMTLYPESDLGAVLTGTKDFFDAIRDTLDD
jgi:hypothetical protein